MCMLDLDGSCSVWSEKRPKARKDYLCCVCRRTIPTGEVYLRHFSVFEGESKTELVCRDCDRDWVTFCEAHAGEKMNPGSFLTHLHECIGDDADEDGEPTTQSARWVTMLEQIESRS